MKKIILIALFAVISAAAWATNWNQFQKDSKHNAEICDVTIDLPLCILWRAKIASSVYALQDAGVPMVDDNGNLLVTTRYYLYSYNALTGALNFQKSINSIETTPVIYNGKIILCSSSSFQAYDTLTGNMVWTKIYPYDFSNPFYSWSTNDSIPSLNNGKIYIGTRSGHVLKIDAETGNLDAAFAVAGGDIEASPSVDDDGTIYVGASDNTMYAVNGGTGAIKWSKKLAYPIRGAATVDSDKIYFLSGSEVYALKKSNGDIAWSYLMYSYGYGTGTIYQDTYNVASDDRYVYSFRKTDGFKRWMIYCEDNFAKMSIIIICGKIYISGCIDKMLRIDVQTGTKDFICYSTNSNFSSPGYWNGRIMFVSQDGYVYVIGKCPPACTCGCDARPTATWEAIHPPSPTRTFTRTSTPTRTSTFTATYTRTQTLIPTDTATFTKTFTSTATATRTFTPTFTATHSATFTATQTRTNTALPTLTFTPTRTNTPQPCDGVKPPVFKVKMIFNPESTDDIIFEIESSVLLSEPPVADIYPHGNLASNPKEMLTFKSELIPGETKKYRILYPKQTGFGDIDRVVVRGTDICGVKGESDGKFDKQVISGKDVQIFKNVIKPDQGERCIIRYKIYGGCTVVIRIFDRFGVMVKELKNETVTKAGEYEVIWNGETDDGRTVTSGIFYAAISTPYYKVREKIAVIR